MVQPPCSGCEANARALTRNQASSSAPTRKALIRSPSGASRSGSSGASGPVRGRLICQSSRTFR